MFNTNQTKLMNILGIVSDTDRINCYDAYCEAACEMADNSMNCGTFGDYLDRKVAIALFIAENNSTKSIKDLA